MKNMQMLKKPETFSFLEYPCIVYLISNHTFNKNAKYFCNICDLNIDNIPNEITMFKNLYDMKKNDLTSK